MNKTAYLCAQFETKLHFYSKRDYSFSAANVINKKNESSTRKIG